ncbi:tryptophan-rich sensory protein [Risungbinella massiliensis]|uniref:tryptophan-rich sensory protein n=1 Tax=Risungbinella massiliensis TaxID=1329796 RepID=UPI0005CC89C9|nr:tryptophan-rich sensory protein [Risungbinella massiliensis]
MRKVQMLHVWNLVSFAILLLLYFVLPIGEQISLIAGQINSLFKPAEYAYGIWIPIYLLLAIWIFYRITTTNNQEIYLRIGYWLPINFGLNALWIYLFTERLFFLSLINILLILISLIFIYFTIQNSSTKTLFFRLPFSLYLGWISVATIEHFFIVLEVNGVNELLGFSEIVWTVILLLVGGIISLIFTNANQDISYSLGFIWAYITIIIQRNDVLPVVIAAWLVVGVLLATVAYQIYRFFQGNRQGVV